MTLSNRLDPVNTESFGLHPISLDAHQWRNLTQCMAHGPVLLLYAPLVPSHPAIPSCAFTHTPHGAPSMTAHSPSHHRTTAGVRIALPQAAYCPPTPLLFSEHTPP